MYSAKVGRAGGTVGASTLALMVALLCTPQALAANETITGDANPNLIVVTAGSPNDATYTVDGGAPVAINGVTSLTIDGGGGADTIRVINPAGSAFAPAGGIHVNGGLGTDTLENLGGAAAGGGHYTPGAGPDAGTITHNSGGPVQAIHFTGIEPTTDTVAEASFVVNARPIADNLIIDNGAALADGQLRIREAAAGFESIEFANKVAVTVNGDPAPADTGVDTADMQATELATGLTNLTVDTGDDPGEVITPETSLPAPFDTLKLFSGGAITDTNGAVPNVTAAKLGMTAKTGINIGTTVDALEAESETGGIALAETDAVEIGGVSPTLRGLRAGTNGNVFLSAAGSITVSDNDAGESIKAGDAIGNVTLLAGGGGSDITSTVDKDLATAPRGDITLNPADELRLGTGGLNFDNDVRASGDVSLSANTITIDGFADIASDDFGQGTGGSVDAFAADHLEITNLFGDDGAITASGNAGGDVTISTGASGLLKLTTPHTAIASDSGDVTVNADRVSTSPNSPMFAPNGIVMVRPSALGRAINLGSATDVAPNTLELSAPEIHSLLAPTVRIGSVLAFTITQITPISTDASTQTLSLITGDSVNQTAGSFLTVPNLRVQASAGASMTNANEVDRLAAKTNGLFASTIAFSDATNLEIASVDGLTGITSLLGDVTLETGGALTINAPIQTNIATLDASGPATQNDIPGAAINTVGTRLLGNGPFSLTNHDNLTGTFASDTTGAVDYYSGSPTTVLAVAGTFGATTTNDSFRLRSGDSLSVLQPVDTGSGPITLGAGAGQTLSTFNPVSGGRAELTGDRMIVDATGPIDVGVSDPSNRVVLGPASANRKLDLGSVTDASPDAMEVSDPELDRITANNITVGGNQAGLATVTAPIAPANSIDLRLLGAGGFTGSGLAGLFANRLTLTDTSAAGRAWTQTALNLNAGPGTPIGYASVNVLTLNGDGADTFNVLGTPPGTETHVNAGPGDDAINVGSPANSLDPIFGPLAVEGEDGTADALNLRDQGDSTDNSYTINSESVNSSGSGLVTYDGIELLDVQGSAGANAFAVKASPNARYSLHGNAPDAAPGDSLVYDPEGRQVSGDTTASAGLISSPGVSDVSYDGMETVTPEIRPQVNPTPPVTPPPTCQGKEATLVATTGVAAQGTAGDDVIVGTSGADSIDAGAGDDLVCALGGPDQVSGGDGDDRIHGEGAADAIAGGAGADALLGGSGKDAIDGSQDADRVRGNAGDDELRGSGGADVITGSAGADSINGGGGEDAMRGGAGDDEIEGGSGRDKLGGDPGADHLDGQQGPDRLRGGTGADQCVVGADDAASGCE